MEREAREEERKQAEQSAEDAGQHIPGRRGVMFSETMKTLARFLTDVVTGRALLN